MVAKMEREERLRRKNEHDRLRSVKETGEKRLAMFTLHDYCHSIIQVKKVQRKAICLVWVNN